MAKAKHKEKLLIDTPVFKDWSCVMQALWTASIVSFQVMGESELFMPKNFENEIFIGSKHKINAFMVNESFVVAKLWEGDKEIVSIRFTGNVNVVCIGIFNVLKHEILAF